MWVHMSAHNVSLPKRNRITERDLFYLFFSSVRKAKLRIAEQYQGAQCGGALQTTTRRRTGETTLRTEKRSGVTETYKFFHEMT